MCNIKLFPFTKRQKAIDAETTWHDRMLLRQLVETSVIFGTYDNIVDMEDAREEMQHRRLG